jgi:hypothetical protein
MVGQPSDAGLSFGVPVPVLHHWYGTIASLLDVRSHHTVVLPLDVGVFRSSCRQFLPVLDQEVWIWNIRGHLARAVLNFCRMSQDDTNRIRIR